MKKYEEKYFITMEDILLEDNAILRKETNRVDMPPTENDQQILKNMIQFLKNSLDEKIAKKYGLKPGIGLSANQIGINKSMFVACLPDSEGNLHEFTLYNPRITKTSTAITYLPEGEGCLSVSREIKGYVPRYREIEVLANDFNGEEIILKLEGLASVVFQHEIDHLNGVMFFDHINRSNPFQLPNNIEISSLY